AREQLLAIAQLFAIQTVDFHVGDAFAVRLERAIGRPEEANRARIAPRPVLGRSRQADKGRNRRIDRALQPRHDGANAGPPTHRPQRILRPTGIALNRIVPAARPDHRAHEHALVGDAGDLREGFANLNAGDFSRNRLEFTAYFLGRFGLDVPHILVR